MRFIKRTFELLNSKAIESVKSFGAQYDAFSIFIFVFFLANPLKWHFSGPYSFSVIFILRMIAILFWLMLAVWRWWPKKAKLYLPLFWHVALIYHLPLRTTFSLLYSKHSPSFDSFGLLGIVALALLVNDRVFCILTVAGSLLGCLIYFTFGGLYIPFIKVVTLSYAGLMVISIAFIKLIFFRNHNLGLAEKIRANKIFAGAIAHEVRVPLSTINLACENGDLNTVQMQAKKSLSIVDSILTQVRYLESHPVANCSMLSLRDTLEIACSNAYFSNDERTNICINTDKNYSVFADQILLNQVFTNLIKNALRATKTTGNGHIKITVDETHSHICISFMDNGIGIEPSQQANLFEPFRSSDKNGVGIGLAFCKLALKNMSGSIECNSIVGRYTRFVVKLPKTARAEKEILDELPASMPLSHDNRAP